MASLFEMTQAALMLYDLLNQEEIDEQTVADTLESMGADEKVESYCKVIKQLQADADMFKAEQDRITARRKTAENAVERMKAALLDFMTASKKDKITAGTFTVSTAITKAVNILDESKIPEQYLKPQPAKIDKAEISKALKNGEAVAGAELIENKGVRIR